jgi:YbgC/YbaW family acyl-CoA thioester hydrolase
MILEMLRSVILNKVNQRKKTASYKPFMTSIRRSFRAGLTDIDFNMHINNARYMVFMERARWDHPVQTNTWNVMLKEKLNFIVAGIDMGYIREIRLGNKFEVETCYLGWDEKYFYLEQRFVVDGKIHAYGLVKAVFLQQGKKAEPHQVANTLGIKQASEALPEHMEIWKRLSSAKRNFSSSPTSSSTLSEGRVNTEEKNAA